MVNGQIVEYEISWHNCIVADSLQEALDQVKSILVDLEKLAKWEKEGKIKGECGCDSPSFQRINVLEESIERELQKVGIVSWCKISPNKETIEDENDDREAA